jgi:3-hydroxyisobutyryl-CoA hydrolase
MRVSFHRLVKFSTIKYPTHRPVDSTMGFDCEHLRIESIGGARVISLNRPKALNALNISMIDTISNALSKWEKSPECRMVIIRGCGETKAFCSGGDILNIALLKGKLSEQLAFFSREYRLNHQIATFSKPILCILDGYTSKTIHNRSGWWCRSLNSWYI